jgi:quercetin dioxygenase-like cupin family protein
LLSAPSVWRGATLRRLLKPDEELASDRYSAKPFPHMNGDHLKTVGVEVSYAPGASSVPHSHPCAVTGYVLQGAIRTQVRGEPEAVYQAGQSFYEPPNGVHQVSANASGTEPARLLAVFTCDSDAPLTVPVADSGQTGPR